MSPRKKLGEILLDSGLIDEIQLNSAIGHQRNWGGKLGSTLVELGFVNEDEIARVLEGQLKQHCLNENEIVPEPGVLKLLTLDDAKKYCIFPLRLKGGEIILAMCNPFDLAVVDEIGFKLGKRVRGVLAVESAIKKAIANHYQGGGGGREYKVELKGGDGQGPPELTQYDEGRPSPIAETAPKKVEPSADLISKAIAYLLIEKGLITREELIDKMKSLKDKGLG